MALGKALALALFLQGRFCGGVRREMRSWVAESFRYEEKFARRKSAERFTFFSGGQTAADRTALD
jgi:hypothetical protein